MTSSYEKSFTDCGSAAAVGEGSPAYRQVKAQQPQQREDGSPTSFGYEARAPFPELESHCGSWIVTSPTGTVRELYERGNAQKAFDAGWKVETAGQYLGRINHRSRFGS